MHTTCVKRATAPFRVERSAGLARDPLLRWLVHGDHHRFSTQTPTEPTPKSTRPQYSVLPSWSLSRTPIDAPTVEPAEAATVRETGPKVPVTSPPTIVAPMLAPKPVLPSALWRPAWACAVNTSPRALK